MANFKINNPQVVGKLKLPAETASKVLQISASGELESSTVANSALAHIANLSSDAVSVDGTQTLTNKTLTAPVINSPTGITKSDVGLSNVDNTSDATKNSATATLTNKTIDAASNTISNITNTNISASAAIVESKLSLDYSTSSLNTAIGTKISSSEKGANNGVATLDAGGKVPASQLPSTVMEFKGVFDPASATFTDAAGNAGDVYLASTAGSYNAGSGSITYAVGDWAVHNGSIFQKSLNSNAVVSVNGQTGIVTLTKSDVGLSNVDNTSDATKNAASVTLTNKTIDADNNTISNLVVANLKAGVLDTDLSSVSASDDTIPSAKATKAYVDSLVGNSGVSGDITLTSFSAANNQSSPANVTGFAFAAGTVRAFEALVSVSISATSPLNEMFTIYGIQKASGFEISVVGAGDDSGIVFSITSAGQIQYTSTSVSGFVSSKIQFRASCTHV